MANDGFYCIAPSQRPFQRTREGTPLSTNEQFSLHRVDGMPTRALIEDTSTETLSHLFQLADHRVAPYGLPTSAYMITIQFLDWVVGTRTFTPHAYGLWAVPLATHTTSGAGTLESFCLSGCCWVRTRSLRVRSGCKLYGGGGKHAASLCWTSRYRRPRCPVKFFCIPPHTFHRLGIRRAPMLQKGLGRPLAYHLAAG